MSKYEYEYDENIELSFYHSTPQFLLNFGNFLKFSNLLNIESFIVRFFFLKKKWDDS